MNKYLVILLSLLFPCVLLAQNRGIRVVDNKGTIIYVDPSKWYQAGSNLFNKNTSGNVAIGLDPESLTPVDVDSRLYISNANSNGAVPVLKLDKPFAGALTDSVLTWDPVDFSVKKIAISKLSPNDWHLLGNAGTNPATNFLGTTDDQPLMFRINNQPSGMLTSPSNGVNTSFGYLSLMNTDVVNGGMGNSAFGVGTLLANTTGTNNTGMGLTALQSNTIGINNAAIGSSALGSNVTGNDNTSMGSFALYAVKKGSGNTGVGVSAGHNLLGSFNTVIGYKSGFHIEEGSSNIVIGANVTEDIDSSRPDASNELNIGNTLFGTGINGAAGGTAGRIGINVQNPDVELDVNGKAKVRNLPVGATTDKIVTADSSGNLRTLLATDLVSATTVSNTSTVNLLTTTVNDVTGIPVHMINSNTLTATNGNLISTVNEVASPAVPVLISANNGLTATNGNVQLGGALTTATTISTDSTNTLAVGGLQAGTATDNIVVADAATNVLKTVSSSVLNNNNWHITGNAGTDPTTNFLGTTDDQPLHFRINNTNAGGISQLATALGYNALNSLNPGIVGNTAIGSSTLQNNTNGIYNTAVGLNALKANNTGNNNTAFGAQALMVNTGGVSNSAFGKDAMIANTTGAQNSSFGWSSLNQNTVGVYNTAFGWSSLLNNINGNYNTAFGWSSLLNNIDGNYNLALGYNALQANTRGGFNVALGYSAGNSVQGDNNIIIGSVTGLPLNTSATTASNEMNIGNALFGTSINQTIGDGSIGINTNKPLATLDVNGNARVRNLPAGLATDNIITTDANGNLRKIAPTVSLTASNGLSINSGVVQLGGTLINPTTTIATTGATNTLAVTGLQAASLTGTDNIVVANPSTGVLSTLDRSLLNNWHTTGNAGTTATGVSGNNFIGTTDQTALNFRINNVHAGWLGYASTGGPGTASVYFGINAGLAAAAAPTSVYSNVGIGDGALSANTTNGNVAIGGSALKNSVNGYNNVAIGLYSLFNNFNGLANVGVGPSALAGNTTGSSNVALGSSAGSTNTTGSSNTFIGMGADATLGALQMATAIGYNAKVAQSNSLILGGTGSFAVNVGIGNDAPTATLDVSGNTRVRNLPAGAASDNLVTADANGNLHNRTVAAVVGSAGWLITGNTGTTPGTNFLGTTDPQPLMFKISSVQSGLLTTNNTSFGYQALLNVPIATATINHNTAMGTGALTALNTGTGENTAVGFNAINISTNSVANTAVGTYALAKIGNSLDGRNTAVGYLAMAGSNTASVTVNTGSNNTAIGISAMNNASTALTGTYNVAIGANALTGSAGGSYNTAVGPSAGSTITGNNNIMIGGSSSGNINPSSPTANNEMNIGNTLFGTSINGAAGGTAGRIGVNTNAPSVALDINGAARVRTLPAGTPTDNIVTADANGNLRTVSPASSIAGTMNIVRKTANYTADPAVDNVILIDAASNDVTVTVPSGVAMGRVFTIKRVDSSTNNVTITFAGAIARVDETDTSISVGNRLTYQIITEGNDKWQTISRL